MRYKAYYLLFIIPLYIFPPLCVGAWNSTSYIYDEQGYTLLCPSPYVPERLIDFTRLSSGSLKNPKEIVIDKNNNIYISDTGNRRILKFDKTGELILEIKDDKFSKPSGLFIDEKNGDIYVADSGSKEILQFNNRGELYKFYPPPVSDVLPKNYIYSPVKILVDKRGWLYILGTGTSGGIIQLDNQGVFRGFLGANPVSFNFWRRIGRLVMSEEQKRKSRMQSLKPSSDFLYDNQGFIYTVTESEETNQIKKLNALGINTFPSADYGEKTPMLDNVTIELTIKEIEMRAARLSSIVVDSKGVVTVTDRFTEKIYQYNQDGDLLFIFGGKGRQLGSFRDATDIAQDSDGYLYVLDGSLGALHVFSPTRFGKQVYKASKLFNDGYYEEALEIWWEILSLNSNYPLAHKGIAKALLKLGRKYEELNFINASMTHYKHAGDRTGYSDAFKYYRYLYLRRHLGFIVLAVFAVFAGTWLFVKYVYKLFKKSFPYIAGFFQTFWKIIVHPLESMNDIKYQDKSRSLVLSIILLILFFIARILTLYFTNYHYANWNPEKISLASEMANLLIPWLSWCFANSLVTAIFDGKGKFSELFTFSAYSLVPFILLSVILTILTHVLTLDENAAIWGIKSFMFLWMGMLFLIGIMVVHDYSLKASIGISSLSVIGIVLLWGVSVLIYGLISSMFGFIKDIILETARNV
jgi:tetratricopeptide (TPR) repeat protein